MQLIFHNRDKTDYFSSDVQILKKKKIQSISFLGRVIINYLFKIVVKLS